MGGRLAVLLAFLASLAGCTTVDVARMPGAPRGPDVFVTTGDLPGPYKSLGVVQATRRGVLLFGFADPAGTELQSDLDEQLLPQVRGMGGDGIINVHFQQTQYGLATRMLFALLFFIPLPSEATITGEVVKLAPGLACSGLGWHCPATSGLHEALALDVIGAGHRVRRHGARLAPVEPPSHTGGPGHLPTTGNAPRPFRTVGFAQVTGYGVTVAGMSDVGEAGLDGAIRGKLSQVAAEMGGDGVIHIDFIDESPPTEVERVSDLSSSL